MARPKKGEGVYKVKHDYHGNMALTPAIQAKICESVERGCYLETAAHYAGVTTGALHQWIDKGRARQQPYKALLEAVDIASAKAEERALQGIMAHGESEWQSLAWYLERRHPLRWSRRSALAVEVQTHGVEGPRLDLTKLTEDELMTLRALKAKATPQVIDVINDAHVTSRTDGFDV